MPKNPKKNPKKFYCQRCDFASNNRRDYNRHLSTTKHKMDNVDNVVDKRKNPARRFVCPCGKRYKFSSGLSKHKNKCPLRAQGNPEAEVSHQPLDASSGVSTEMFNKLMEQNNTLLRKLVKLSKDKTVIYNQNCNNKKMTINVFLQEQCKNAMNLTDFVDNVKVSIADLMYTKEHGYIKGISNIFVKNLRDMDPTERPIHCSDKKRLQFYVKDEDKWEKDKTHEKIDKSIQDITVKQIKSIREWEKEHPNYLTDEKLLVEWHTMVQHIMGGGEDVERNKNKEQIKKTLCTTTELKGALDAKAIEVDPLP